MMEAGAPAHRVSRVLGRVVTVVIAIFLAALFWLLMVLIQPPRLEDPVPAPTVAATVSPTAPAAMPEDGFSAAEDVVEIEW